MSNIGRKEEYRYPVMVIPKKWPFLLELLLNKEIIFTILVQVTSTKLL